MSYLLNSRKFNWTDQLNFAKFSGDFNPIHMDSMFARRTMAGECIVHGIHGFLYALDCLLKYNKIVREFNVRFLKPIPLGLPIHCELIDEFTLNLVSLEGIHLTLTFKDCASQFNKHIHELNWHPPLSKPSDKSFSDCLATRVCNWSYCGDKNYGEYLFPELIRVYGITPIIERSSSSEVIGMRCPGLNSLYVSLQGRFISDGMEQIYKLESHDNRFKILNLSFRGFSISALAKVFYRQVEHENDYMQKIITILKGIELKNINALIVGGSRGIGEMVAKIITFGGGRVTITYKVGIADALRVQSEIKAYGGKCDVVKLDINDSYSFPSSDFNQFYYFATPIIKKDFSDQNGLLESAFDTYYVEAFAKFCNKVLKLGGGCSIFYPSTIYIDKPKRGYSAYRNSKIRGEKLCSDLNLEGRLRVLCKRLPTMPTDQTLGFLQESLPDPISVLYPIVLDMSAC